MRILKPKSVHYASAIALSLGLMAPMAAIAQDADDSVAAETDTQEEELKQETVYVTARKRDETQLEVPVAVTAFSQDNLDERGITNAANLSDFVPGFKFENTGQGGFSGRSNPSIRFRGVGVQVGSAASRAGALFWDGAYVADGIGILPLIDLQQTEVIKGPQTAFFGRNTFAGAVNFIPSEPGDEFYGRLSGGLTATDEDGGKFFNAIASGPITDQLSGRLAISYEDRAGTDEFQDGSTLGDEETIALIGSLKYDATENLTFKYSGYIAGSEDNSTLSSISGPFAAGECNQTFSGDLRDVATGADAGSFTTDLSTLGINTLCGTIPDFDSGTVTHPAFGGGVVPAGVNVGIFGLFATLDSVNTRPAVFDEGLIAPPDGLGNTYEIWRHHVSGDYDLENGHSLSGFVSVGNSEVWSTFDGAYGVTDGFGSDLRFGGFITAAEDISAEARFASPDEGKFRYMIGLSYYQQDSTNAQLGGFLLDPILTIEEGENWGIFGSIDYDITNSLTLSAEGRYADDTQTLVFNGPSAQIGTATDREQSFGEFMPRVILSWQPENAALNIYGSYSLSYLQGNTTGVEAFEAQTGNTVPGLGFFTPPQKLEAFELGIKHDLNSLFKYSAALYQMDWENQVFFDLSPFPVFASIFQPGDSEYLGLEVEGTFTPTDWLTIAGGYNYVDAELTDFVATGSVTSNVLAPGLITGASGLTLDATGNQPRYIPAHSGNVSVDLDFGDFTGRDSFFRIDGIYTGDLFVDNAEFNQVDANWKVNLRAGIGVNEWMRAEVFGTNVFDDRSFQASGGTTTVGAAGGRGAFGAATRGAEWGFRLTAEY